MEAESPSQYPQVPAICPYPEPTPSSPHDPLQLPEDNIWHNKSLDNLRRVFLAMGLSTYLQ
jgi:hypothetical protein